MVKVCSTTKSITFIDEELLGVQTPHNDALVITLRMADCDVKRLLINQGSFSEVMYYNLFKILELKDSDLQLSLNPLVRFSSDPVWPLGKMTIPMTAEGITSRTEFLVVDIPSPYNAFMGQTWLHLMKAVPSFYHQLIKFPIPEEVGGIKGDQVAAKQCFLTACTTKVKTEKVQMMELHEDAPTIEDVGQTPKK